MTEQRALTRAQIITQLTKSPHGDLAEYEDVGRMAARDEQEFFAHLIAWNDVRGNIRDSKVALPVLALTGTIEREFIENAVALIAKLRPRDFLRALDYARTVKAPDRLLRRLASRYCYDLEADPTKWVETALLHRHTLKSLYARNHFGSTNAEAVLFLREGRPAVFDVVKNIARSQDQRASLAPAMTPGEVAGAIRTLRIPFLIARGAAGKLCDEPVVLAAIISRMSPTDVQTNLKWIERRAGKDDAQVKAELSRVVKRSGRSTATPLKATKAVEHIDDEAVKTEVKAAQEQALNALGNIEGRWLLLVDKSGSMSQSIGIGREIASLLARMCPEVHLVFFDSNPREFDVTGKTLAEIEAMTKHVTSGGGTDIGCGLRYAVEKGWEIDAIAVVSDGGDGGINTFPASYRRLGNEPPVYFYKLNGDADRWSDRAVAADIDVQTFDLRGSVDSYSLPTLVRTMRAKRYALADEILATPLRTLDSVLTNTVGRPVMARAQEAVAV